MPNEHLIKCLRGDITEGILKNIDKSDLSEERKAQIKAQLESIKTCRGKPIDLETIESISSLTEVLDGSVNILVDKECPECQEIKERLKDNKAVALVDMDSQEGDRVSRALGIKEAPTAYTYEKGEPKKCEIFKDKDTVLAVCGDKTIPLEDKSEDANTGEKSD